MLFFDPVMSCTIQCSSSRFRYMQGYTLATQRACQKHRISDLLLSMCTSHMVPKRLFKIWETLVYTESVFTWLQLNSFSRNLSLHFLMQTCPPPPRQTEMALEIGNLPVDSLWGCGILGLPIMPPALSFFPALLFCPMWHHAGKQQYFVWHRFAHITAEHLWPCSPRGWHTALHGQGPQFWTSS